MRLFFFSSEEWVEESLEAQANSRNISFKSTGSFSAEHPHRQEALRCWASWFHHTTPAEAQLPGLQLGKLIAWFLS